MVSTTGRAVVIKKQTYFVEHKDTIYKIINIHTHRQLLQLTGLTLFFYSSCAFYTNSVPAAVLAFPFFRCTPASAQQRSYSTSLVHHGYVVFPWFVSLSI